MRILAQKNFFCFLFFSISVLVKIGSGVVIYILRLHNTGLSLRKGAHSVNFD